VTLQERELAVRLTSFASGGGCATKIGQADLLRLLGGWPAAADPRVVVGPATGDDAAVLQLRAGGPQLVLTTDFFAPIVDDPDD
jgi:selenide,water dikinase